MASPAADYLRSPFDNVFQILPQGHEKLLKQAFYNTAATLFVIFVCGAAVAVYFVLEPFLRSLLWAVLCGTFLHPFKSTITNIVRGWLRGLGESGTPIAVGVFMLPIQAVDTASETLGGAILTNLKLILTITIGLPLVYILYHFGPLHQILSILTATFYFVYDALGYFSAFWVWSLVLAYSLVVIFSWTPERSRLLSRLSCPVWVALLLHLATIAGPLRVPIFVALVVLMIVGFVAEINQTRKKQTTEEETLKSPTAVRAAWAVLNSTNTTDSTQTTPNTSVESSSLNSSAESPLEKPPEAKRPQSLETETPRRRRQGLPPVPEPQQLRSLSDHCFIGLFWAIVLVRVWIHVWILQLLPILFAFLFVKKIGSHFGAWKFLQGKLQSNFQVLSSWTDHRIDVIAPKFIRGLGKLIIRGDRKIVSGLEKSLDKIMSILLILVLFFGALFFALFAAFQVHQESMHIVTSTSNILNNSLNPEVSQWLPKSADMQTALDSMVGKAYLYGRQWIASKIHSVINGEHDNKTKIQEQALEIFDRLYENYFAKNMSSMSPSRHVQPVQQLQLSMFTNATNVWDLVKQAKAFDLDIVSFLKENIGIFMSVLESIWIVLKGNINLVMSAATATLSLLFGGGTAILNFLLALIVFVTTLFYLLASSGVEYKPLEWFSSFSPTQGSSKFAPAVEQAISGVFKASLKMASFYGLYTWLTHTVFGVNVVFIPSVLAAMFGAIPFVGTYWAALPAAVELWLVKGDGILALLLIVCHLIPTSVVDTAIYSDIQGGGHPYLTGLSIAGGMYCLGLEGAILGPILLCCLIVAVNVYSNMLRSESEMAASTSGVLKQARSLNRDERRVKFDLKRAYSADDTS